MAINTAGARNNIPNIGLIVAPSVQESSGMVKRKHFVRKEKGRRTEHREKSVESVTYIYHTVYETYTAFSYICMRRGACDDGRQFYFLLL